jgi:hypothetical protein
MLHQIKILQGTEKSNVLEPELNSGSENKYSTNISKKKKILYLPF